MKINRGTVGIGIVGVAILLALAGCDGDSIAIGSKDVGPEWPFTVSEVRVVCAPTFALFISADGKAYPLNGQAERHPDLYGKGPLSKLSDIWKVDPEISRLSPDTRMSLNAFTHKAIEACAKAGKWASSTETALSAPSTVPAFASISQNSTDGQQHHRPQGAGLSAAVTVLSRHFFRPSRRVARSA
jgi:Protein of unknown function (DUF2511)